MQIEFQNVSYEIAGDKIIRDISFTVPTGGNCVILGSSGSGKTTMLRLLLRLISPSHGKILIDGVDTHSMKAAALSHFRKRLAIVFQHSALFDSLTVEENVGYRLMEEGWLPGKEIRKIVDQALEFVGLKGEQKKMPYELSGGMKKRVAIARAIASGAEAVLFDEPTAGLDPVNAVNITQLIIHLRDYHSITTIVVTHDLHHAFEVASRIILLDEGEIIFEGSVEDLRNSKDRRVTSFVSPTGQDLVSSSLDAVMGMSRKRLEQLR